MNALTIPTGEAAIVFFAERLGSLRALDDTESRILHRAIIRETGSFRRWTKDEDAQLLKMSKARIRQTEIAKTLQRSEDSVRYRLQQLKKASKVKRRG